MFAMDKSQFEVFKKAQSIESLLGWNVNAELTGEDLPEDVAVRYLTENADTFFGVRALLGRGIQPSDAEEGGQHVAVAPLLVTGRSNRPATSPPHFKSQRASIGSFA